MTTFDFNMFSSVWNVYPLPNLEPERAGQNATLPDALYNGVRLEEFSPEMIRRILAYSDELTGYELGMLLPAIVAVALKNPDDEHLRDAFWNLGIVCRIGALADGFKRAMRETMTTERYDALQSAVSSLIALNAHRDEGGDILVPLSWLKKLVCEYDM